MSADDLDAYVGEWVVLRADRVIDHDPDPDVLRARVALRPDDALVPVGAPPQGYQIHA